MPARRSTDSINTTMHRDDRGNLHHETEPAVHWLDGTAVWYIHGRMHREDGPAIEHPSGKQEWYFEGKKHRSDGPAVIHPDGSTEQWEHGIRTDPPTPSEDD